MAERMSERGQVETLAQYCGRMYARGLVHATAGNASIKTPDGILITGKGTCLGEISPGMLVPLADNDENPASHGLPPSSEWRIHRRIYQAREDIRAIVHAHPPKATAMTLAGVALDQDLLAEVVLSLGKVPMIPYILPGSDELAEALFEAFHNHHAVMLANHGVFTTGQTIREAFFRMELVESLAEMVIHARQLGKVNELSQAQVSEILQKSEAGNAAV